MRKNYVASRLQQFNCKITSTNIIHNDEKGDLQMTRMKLFLPGEYYKPQNLHSDWNSVTKFSMILIKVADSVKPQNSTA